MLSLGITWYFVLIAESIYPTYSSFKAIQSSSIDDDKQWLTYWVVYSVIKTFESVAGFVLPWIPLYQEVKLLLVIWMIAPQTNGALVLYDQHIKPFLIKYASRIDPYFGRAEEMLASKYTGVAAQLVQQYGPTVADQALKMAQTEAARLNSALNGSSSGHHNTGDKQL